MTVCDICKTKQAGFNVTATIDDDGKTQTLELCGLCWREFQYREDRAKHQAYEETLKAINGEIPRKSRWWHMFNR